MNGSILQKRRTLHQQLRYKSEQNNHLSEQVNQLHGLVTVGMAWTMTAHEMNNILSPIANYAQLALNHPDDRELTEKALKKAVYLGHKAVEILQRVMVIAGQRERDEDFVSVKKLIEDVFLCIGRDMKKEKIHVCLTIPENLAVSGDGALLRQVFMNIILNACHSMSQGGGTLKISAYSDHEAVWIEISDTGCGMEAEVMRRIFEPFFSTKCTGSKPANNGLGLSFCKQIIEKHDGLISVESQPGQGTCFKIRLAGKTNSDTLTDGIESVIELR